MIDFSYISQAPIKDCLVLVNTLSRTLVQNTLLLAQTFSTELKLTASRCGAHFQLDLGHFSLHAPFPLLLEVTSIVGGVGEGRLQQVSKPPLC